MVQETDNHDLNKYEQGDKDWDHSPDMQHIEERLVIRDVEANLSNYTPHAAATFRATDTGAVYDGDGSSWNKARRELESLGVGSVQIGNADSVDGGPVGSSGEWKALASNRYASGAVTTTSTSYVLAHSGPSKVPVPVPDLTNMVEESVGISVQARNNTSGEIVYIRIKGTPSTEFTINDSWAAKTSPRTTDSVVPGGTEQRDTEFKVSGGTGEIESASFIVWGKVK